MRGLGRDLCTYLNRTSVKTAITLLRKVDQCTITWMLSKWHFIVSKTTINVHALLPQLLLLLQYCDCEKLGSNQVTRNLSLNRSSNSYFGKNGKCPCFLPFPHCKSISKYRKFDHRISTGTAQTFGQ